MNLKNIIKKNPLLLSMVKKVLYRPIYNYFGTEYKKKVLFSYSTFHFKSKNYLGHSNYNESIIIADIFNALGYQVDIVNNNEEFKGDMNEYDVIFGEGLPLYQAGINNIKGKKIYYGTGSHPWQCTNSSYQRLISHTKKGRLNGDTALRLQDPRWGVGVNLANSVICIGNLTTKKTYIDNGIDEKKIRTINPSFYLPSNIDKYEKSNSANKTALWFGSTGLLHKGLDVTIDAFNERNDWKLFVCGKTDDENEFIKSLKVNDNINIEGFLSIDSPEFINIVKNTNYVILPSCSEGIATSVITAMGRGYMIPIVTKDCGVDIDDFGYLIKEINKDSILSILNDLDNLSNEEIKIKAIKARENALLNYTPDLYKMKMTTYLKDILSE